jgi:uncharacterized protein YacL
LRANDFVPTESTEVCNSNKPSPEDIRKSGEEVKQLRNQQFILGTTAFGLFNAYGTLLPDFGQSPDVISNADAIAIIWSSIALILIFGFLFYWSRQLRLLIGVISIWLDVVAESVWERDYRAYHQTFSPFSKTSLVSFAFCALGLVVPFLVRAVLDDVWGLIAWPHRVSLYAVVIVYVLAVFFGFVRLGIRDETFKRNWKVIKERND